MATGDGPTLKMKLQGHKKPITGLTFNPEGAQFASSSEDNTIMVWHMNEKTRTYCFKGHTDVVTAVEYSPDGKILASCSLDQTVRLWVPTIKGTCREFRAHLAPVRTLAFSGGGVKLITGSNDKSIKLWSLYRKQFISSFVGHTNWVRGLQYSEDNKIVVSCGDDHTVRVWDAHHGTPIHVFKTSQGGFPTSISLHKDANSVAVSTSSGSMRIYNIGARKLQQHYVLHDYTNCVCWHPCGNYLLTCGKDGKVIVVDAMEGRPRYTIKAHEGAVNYVRFDTKGEEFVTGGVDKIISVWQTNFI